MQFLSHTLTFQTAVPHALSLGCQVLNGPLQGTSISVQEGEVATFSCEIDCSNDGLSWFVGIDDKTYAVGAFINHLKLIGIDAEMQVNDAACDAGEEGDSRNKTSMLTIVTSAMLDRAPVQCASSCLVSSCLCGGSNAIFRSPFAILRVESDTTPATEMPTVPPMPASSSSSAFPQPTSSSSVAMMAATPESRTSSSTTQQTLCQPTLGIISVESHRQVPLLLHALYSMTEVCL